MTNNFNITNKTRIFNALKNGNKMSARLISARLNINYNTVRRIIGELLNSKKIRRTGYTKTTGYTLYTSRV